MNKNNGGPAFPTLHIPDCSPPAWNGMALRDYFAAKAMQAIIGKWGTINHKSIAEVAYQLADAMLAEREKGVDSVVKESLTTAPKEYPMNNDLLKRIDEEMQWLPYRSSKWQLFADCRAEIERKATYVPMTDDERWKIFMFGESKQINETLAEFEAAVIKRAGLEIKHD